MIPLIYFNDVLLPVEWFLNGRKAKPCLSGCKIRIGPTEGKLELIGLNDPVGWLGKLRREVESRKN